MFAGRLSVVRNLGMGAVAIAVIATVWLLFLPSHEEGAAPLGAVPGPESEAEPDRPGSETSSRRVRLDESAPRSGPPLATRSDSGGSSGRDRSRTSTALGSGPVAPRRDEAGLGSREGRKGVAGGRGLHIDPLAATEGPVSSEVAASDTAGSPSSDSPVDDGSRERDFSLEIRAAQLAQDLELVDPRQLDYRVALRVPDDSAPAAELAQQREIARLQILAEEAVLENLARNSLGDRATPRALRDRRDLGRTLLSTQSTDYMAEQMQKALEQLETDR